MKKASIILFILFISFSAFAQNVASTSGLINSSGNEYARMPKQETLGKTVLTCVYATTVFDPILKQKEQYRSILLSGENVSYIEDYIYFQIDSVINLGDRHKFYKRDYEMLRKKFSNGKRKFCAITKDFNKREIDFSGYIFADNYRYTEKIPDFEWQLTGDTATIKGHLCHNATMTFRGREWTAWYDDSIKVSDGPWKFCGLPGLIISINSCDGEIKMSMMNIIYREIDILRDITTSHFNTKRETFLKMEANYKLSPKQVIQGLVQMADGSDLPNRRLFYNPIEKDIKITQ